MLIECNSLLKNLFTAETGWPASPLPATNAAAKPSLCPMFCPEKLVEATVVEERKGYTRAELVEVLTSVDGAR